MTSAARSWMSPHRRFVLGVTLAYAVAISLFAVFHEVWRDEVVPLSLVAESRSLADVFRNMHNFGHPGLWYVLLYAGYQIFPNYVILKVLNIAICIGAIWLFLDKAPFHWATKVLFVCGFFPLYLYPVVNRMYGLSMLMTFVVSALYADRWRRPMSFGVALALMANTHAHALVLVLAMLTSVISEFFVGSDRKALPIGRRGPAVGLLIALAGVVAAVLQILPDSRSVIFTGGGLGPNRLVHAVLQGLVNPGTHFAAVFGFDSAWSVNLVVFTLYLYLLRKTSVWVFFVSGVFGLSMFFELFYPTLEMRHQGILFLLVIMALWMERSVRTAEPSAEGLLANAKAGLSLMTIAILLVLLVMQVVMAYPVIREDLESPFSASKLLAERIRSDPELTDAILLGEPEGYLESLPYYLDNPLYFYTEGKFTRYRRLTSEGLMTLSLGELLQKARLLRSQQGRPVVILLGEDVGRGKTSLRFMHSKKTFTFSREELKQLDGADGVRRGLPGCDLRRGFPGLPAEIGGDPLAATNGSSSQVAERRYWMLPAARTRSDHSFLRGDRSVISPDYSRALSETAVAIPETRQGSGARVGTVT